MLNVLMHQQHQRVHRGTI